MVQQDYLLRQQLEVRIPERNLAEYIMSIENYRE
jgi:hypothetical protein